MKAEYVNPFLEAFNNVAKQLLNVETKLGKLFLKEGSQSSQGVVISIGVTGDLTGNIVLNMGETVAKSIASSMMYGVEIKELDDMAKSALAEFGNMVAGNSTSFFSNIGKNISITPPSLFTGNNLSMYNHNSKIMCVPMDLGNHIIELDLALK